MLSGELPLVNTQKTHIKQGPRVKLWIIAVLALALVASLFVNAMRDHRANDQFLDRAKASELIGKDQSKVEKTFGRPDRYYTNAWSEEVWVYTPGPILSFWTSRCHVVFDIKNGKVIRYGAHSD